MAAADPLVGVDKLKLDPIGRTAHLTVTGMRLELSSLVRGFACDRVLYRLARAGFPAAMVDAGGVIAVGDPPPGAEGWRVEVTNAPRRGKTRLVTLVRRAIASSGRAGDVVALDGRAYARALDPRTGIGAANLSAATVIARRAWQAAALARVAAVQGPEEGRRLVATVRDARVSFHAPPGTGTSPQGSPADPTPGEPSDGEPRPAVE